MSVEPPGTATAAVKLLAVDGTCLYADGFIPECRRGLAGM